MNITLYQKEAIENYLNVSEAIVFSLLKTFKNVMSFDEIVHNLPILYKFHISNSIVVLLKKDLIETSTVEGVLFYKIKK